MQVSPIAWLVPGSRVLLNSSATILKVETKESDVWFSPVGTADDPPLIRNIDPKPDAKLEEIVSVPEEPTRNVLLARMDGDEEDPISAEAIRLIQKGGAYTVGLDDDDADDADDERLEATIFCILEQHENCWVALGVITASDSPQLAKDENIVAVMDLLGFSEILRTHSLDDLEQKLTGGLISSLAFTGLMSGEAILFDDEGNIELSDELRRVSYSIISDTVLLYLRSTSVDQPLRIMCEAVAQILDMAIPIGWLFRGAIELGEFRAVKEEKLFIGNALADAYQLEKSQNWSGCILGDNVRQRCKEEVEELLTEGLLVECDIPMKEAARIVDRPGVAVNWCYLDISDGDTNARQRMLQSLLKKAPVGARPKVNATLVFLNTVKERSLLNINKRIMPAINFAPRVGDEDDMDSDDEDEQLEKQ